MKSHKRETHTPDFVELYLEQNQHNSNIYFFLEQQELAGKGKNAPQKKVLWRFFLRAGSLAALFLFGVSALALMEQGTAQKRAPVWSGTALYDDVLAGHALLADLRFKEAAEKFSAARGADARNTGASGFFSSLAQLIGPYFSSSQFAPLSPAAETLQSAARSAARGYELFLSVSSGSLLGKGSARSAGALFAEAEQEIKKAQGLLAKVKDAVQEGLPPALSRMPLLAAQQDRFAPYLRLLRWAFDPEHPKKFLVVVEDQDIPRATGGFIGAYGVVTIEGGVLARGVFDDVRNLDGQLETNIIPPRQLQNATTAWSMRDANWFLDFPTSARKIASFYERSGGEDVDGVIAVQSAVLESLLGAETDSILGSDAFATLIERIAALPPKDFSAALRALDGALEQKNIMVWLADKEYQKTIVERAWDGGIVRHDAADYTAVAVHAMDEENARGLVRHDMVKHTEMLDSGDIINTVALEFHRSRQGGEPESNDDGLYYIKLYAPKGSRLIAASGGEEQVIVPQLDYAAEYFMPDEDVYASESTLRADHADKTDIFDETDKTVFGTWITLGGKSAKLLYHYTVPLGTRETQGTFTSFFQKQPGASGTLQFSVTPPDGKGLVGPDAGAFTGEFSGSLASDLAFTATLQ